MSEIFDTEISHSTIIKASIEKVYDSISTAEGLDEWFTKGAVVDNTIGGTIYFRRKTKDANNREIISEDKGIITEFIRPYHFAFKWQPDNDTYYTTVHFKLDYAHEGTIIFVQEHGFKNTSEGRKILLSNATSWGETLTILKYYLEHGITY